MSEFLPCGHTRPATANTLMVVNVEMIRSFRSTPDTVIPFITNDKMMVKEPIEELSKRILAYRRAIHSGGHQLYGILEQFRGSKVPSSKVKEDQIFL